MNGSTGKTRIVCTLGPASGSVEEIQALADAGMNVARLNFSHGNHDEHAVLIRNVMTARKRTGRNIGIMQDLGGPKIRTGDLPGDGLVLSHGSVVLLEPSGSVSDRSPDDSAPVIPIDFPSLLEDVEPGARVLLDDGLLDLTVEGRRGGRLECRVVTGGKLLSHKGVNFPGLKLSARAPTPKDLEDLRFGLANAVDYVALSFVQDAEDIMTLRRHIQQMGGSASIVAKLERMAAVEQLQAILSASDVVMVARGDLGIEAEMSMVPVYQKRIITAANRAGVPVIVATQMLDSMIRNPRPTRAEVTDVANAVEDGADAVMLSGETSVGGYPVDCVRTMRTVASRIEENIPPVRSGSVAPETSDRGLIEAAVAESVCTSAETLGAKLIAQTISGATALLLSQRRPSVPVLAVTPREDTLHRLSMAWGVEAVLVRGFESSFLETTRKIDAELVSRGLLEKGDLVVVSAGIPAGESGLTNTMKVHRVGDLSG